MAGNVIGTSSYSEAMDLSDLDDCGYEQDSVDSPSPPPSEQQTMKQDTTTTRTKEGDTPPIKIRKKPGRKPNPASPALRKAQNRAAQRAFRERKERHMKDLESNIKGIKDHRDKLLQDNEKMSSENEILKAENWYLKGIVLSLQLVCLQHNLVIPQHCPHVDEQTLSVLNQSIPESIASYINVNSKNKLQISSKLMNDSPEISRIKLQQQQQHQHHLQQQQQQQQQQHLPSGSLIITKDGVHTVPEKHHTNNTSWYHQSPSSTATTTATTTVNDNSSHRSQSPLNNNGSISSQSYEDNIYSNIPPLSPMSTNTVETNKEVELPKPILLSNEPVTSNLAAIQTLRLRLRLQSACVRMQSIPFAIQPTLLQLTIPHDPRIDLIPTPHMRDRMILYRDQFDLDDCFRCLLSGSVFHGGDPAIAGNWQLPPEFFEKYWFLTIDYNLRRCTNEWRKLQGLKEIKSIQKDPLPQPPQPPQSHLFHMPTSKESNLTYEDLSGYLGVQLNGLNKNQEQQQQQQQQQQRQESTPDITPIQLTNGYGMMNSNQQQQQQQQQERKSMPANQTSSPWENLLMGQKNYDMMMSGLYSNNNSNSNSSSNNNNDMDQNPH